MNQKVLVVIIYHTGGPIVNFISPTIDTHVGYFNYYSGEDSQQWLIAPIKPGSDEFFIINKYSGNPIYVDGTSVKYNESTIEKNKQIFKFQNINGEYCQITLVSDVGFLQYKRHTLYDLALNPNGYYYSLAYYTNKPNDDYSYFKLTVAEDIPGASNVSATNLINNTNQAGAIPFPPQLSSFDDQLSDYVNTTTIGETWVPFCLVNDPQRSRKLQVQETPYYKLIRKQAYYKIITETNTPGVTQEITRTEKYGVTYSETQKFQTTLNHSWSAEGKIEVKLSELIPSLSANYSQKLEISNTQVNEYSTITEITKEISRKISFNSTQQVRLLIFNLADIISFERMNGTNVFDDTTILDKDKTANSAWPSEGIIKEYDPVLNKITITDDFPPNTPQNLSIAWYSNHPKLTWDTNDESDIQSYKIWKHAEGSSMIAATVPHNSSNSTHSWTDNSVEPAGRFDPTFTYSYKVKAVDNSNQESSYSNQVSISGTGGIWKKNDEEEKVADITTYVLNSNYPNPFNPTTQISYQIPENSFVSLVVYNTLGQEVATLVNQHQSTGKYTVQFNASSAGGVLPSGVYIYKLVAGEFSSVKKMLLTK